MNRHQKLQALVISVKLIGENNRLVNFFSPEIGLFNAVLYGGPKSKLRAMVSPFHSGNLWIYNDEVKHSKKVTDFEVLKFRSELRENLYKTWCADFCMELLMKTEAAGENDKAWIITNGFLDGLCISTEDECKLALLRFIWRFLDILGLQCDCRTCVNCGNKLYSDSVYSLIDNGFICNTCGNSDNEVFQISAEALTYLQAITFLSAKESRNIPLHNSSTLQLKNLLFFLINRITDNRLKTLQSNFL